MRISLTKQLIKRLITQPFFWVAAFSMLSASASAVGLGGINVVSSLGQPLKANIEIVAISKADRPSLVARLASPDAYKSAGLEYPFGNNFRFQIESRADGEPYLIVSSAKSISDPFVTLLVELTWSSGKLSREYTFLLDPVGYVPQQPAQAEVQAVAPAVQAVVPAEPTAASGIPAVPTEAAAATEVPVESSEAVTSAVALPETVTTSEVPVAAAEIAAVPVDVAPKAGGGTVDVVTTQENQEWLVVRRGDTLTEIADQYKLADISLERMLVALYRVNVKEFDGKNMNRIRAGKILQLPRQEDVDRVTQREAAKEIHAQAADWNAYRQKLASAAAASKESQSAQQDVAGKVSSSVADKAPVAKESAKEVLKLSKGEAPGDKVASGAGAASAQDRKNAAQEETIANAKAVKEEQMRTAKLEKNIQDMKRLAELKAAGTTRPPAAAESKVAVVSPLAAASGVAAASAVKPVAVAKPKPQETIPEPSLVDQILAEPLYLAGGAGVLLALGGAGFMLKRRKKKSSLEIGEEEPESGETSGDAGSTSNYMSEPVKPSPATGDFTRTVVTQAQDVSQDDNVDPISEADLFLNFGRDAQAEEILKEALKNTPNNHQIHLKLLGIYANRKDASSFATIASQLKDSDDEHAWQEAVGMGSKLDPNNPMYGGSGSMDNAAASQKTTVFDAGAAGKTVVMSAGDMAAIQQPTSMDFDLSAASSPAPAVTEPVAAPNLDDLIFDVTGGNTSASAAQPAASKPAAPANDGAMEFTMDFPVADAVKPAAATPASASDFGGISLNLGDTAAPAGSSSENKSDQWQEVATKLDLAKAYQEMGDADGVREILAEVLNEGDAEQQETAKSMLKQLG